MQHAAVVAGTLGIGNFKKQEQQLGYNYSPHGLLASDMAEAANLPDSIFMDWMHSLCSSGGMGQYEVKHLKNILSPD